MIYRVMVAPTRSVSKNFVFIDEYYKNQTDSQDKKKMFVEYSGVRSGQDGPPQNV